LKILLFSENARRKLNFFSDFPVVLELEKGFFSSKVIVFSVLSINMFFRNQELIFYKEIKY